jgi:hypothetical protein
MSFGSVEARIAGSVLQISWGLFATDPRAISIQVATDANFTKNYAHFVLPTMASSVGLDLGAGTWFYRLGVWSGKDHEGSVDWTATYGPAAISCAKPTFAAPAPVVSVLHSYPTPGGIRLATNISEKTLVCLEICKGSAGFEANNTTMRYVLNWGNGTVDVAPLDPANSYSVRISRFPTTPAAFPSTALYTMPAGAIVRMARPLRVARHGDGHQMAAAHAGAAMLKEAAERPTMRFPSQAAYMRYLASKTGAAYH